MDFDGFWYFHPIARAKRIMRWLRDAEIKRLRAERLREPQLSGIFDDYRTITVTTASFRANLTRCLDMGDGSTWFEFELQQRDARGDFMRIFANTNWRHREHYYADASAVLRGAQRLREEYRDELRLMDPRTPPHQAARTLRRHIPD